MVGPSPRTTSLRSQSLARAALPGVPCLLQSHSPPYHTTPYPLPFHGAVDGTNVEDVQDVPAGINITFKWARFPGNVTEELDALTVSPERHEFVVASFCMWSVVFRPGPELFARGVAQVDAAAKASGVWSLV